MPFPGPLRAPLAASVRDLHAGGRSLLANEANDGLERLGVGITPDSEVLRADASFGGDRGRFEHHQRRPADRARAEV